MRYRNENQTETRFRGTPKGGDGETNPCTRTAILEAAQRRFLHYGYKKTTIDDIAAEAGIGKGTIYLYFGNKEEILLTIAHSVKRNITEQMRAIASSLAPPEEKLRRMLLASILTVHSACNTTAHGVELVDEMLRPKLTECGRVEKEAQFELIATVLREGVRSGQFSLPNNDALSVAKLVSLAMVSFYPPYVDPCHGHTSCKFELERRANTMVDFLLNGLRQRPNP